jgi:exosortase/archaeosortase family protein
VREGGQPLANRLLDAAPVTRATLFFWAAAAAVANAFAGIAIRTWAERGAAYALFSLFGISAVAWMAAAAALALLARERDRTLPNRVDWIGAAAVGLASVVPGAPASSVALSFLALYMVATAPRGSSLSRSGIICVALSGTLIWGRVLLALFSRPLLDVDAWLVGKAFGSPQSGNLISFVDGSGRIIVAPGCSSWQGLSIALLFWATVNQWFAVRFDRRAALTLSLALLATVAVNVLRMGAMIEFPRQLPEIHHGYGWHIAVWASLLLVGTICFVGARREILDL